MADLLKFSAIPHAQGQWKDLASGTIATADATRDATLVSGVNGLPALQHDGTNDSTRFVVGSSLNFRKRFVCTVFFKLDVLKTYNHIISRGDPTDYNFDIYSPLNGSINIRLRTSTGTLTLASSTGLIKANKWHVLSVSWSAENAAGSLLYYLDGKLVYTHNPTYTELTDSTGYYFVIGSYQAYLSFTDGAVQLVNIHHDTGTGHIYDAAWHKQNNMNIRSRLYLPDSKYEEFRLSIDGAGAASDAVGKRTVTAVTAGYPLVTNTGWNGRPVFACDGVNNRGLTLSSGLPLTQDWTMYFELINPGSNNDRAIFYQRRTSPTLDGMYCFYITNSTVIRWINALAGTFTPILDIPIQMASQVLTLTYQHSTGKRSAFIDGKYITGDTGNLLPAVVDSLTPHFYETDTGAQVPVSKQGSVIFRTGIDSATEIASFSKHLRTTI